jgi:hypothetical protein
LGDSSKFGLSIVALDDQPLKTSNLREPVGKARSSWLCRLDPGTGAPEFRRSLPQQMAASTLFASKQSADKRTFPTSGMSQNSPQHFARYRA